MKPGTLVRLTKQGRESLLTNYYARSLEEQHLVMDVNFDEQVDGLVWGEYEPGKVYLVEFFGPWGQLYTTMFANEVRRM